MTYPYILTANSSLSIMIDNKNYIVEKSHANFAKIVDAIKKQQWESIKGMIDIPTLITTFGQGKVSVKNGMVFYNSAPVDNSLTRRILALLNDGFDITPFIKFMENLMLNPSKQAVDELYDFLERCSLPITEDGHFLAYKKVNTDYKDFYTGKFDHSIGNHLAMPRNEVNDNRNTVCSTGFHFCSFSYLPHYATGRAYKIMIVKINPADVVSIPVDYNFAKGRAYRYKIVDEHTEDENFTKEKFDKSCYDYSEPDLEDPVDVEVTRDRDSFTKEDFLKHGEDLLSGKIPLIAGVVTGSFNSVLAAVAPTPAKKKKLPVRGADGRFMSSVGRIHR